MSIIRSADPDFRICRINFDVLLDLQAEAEAHGWATRWSSTDALRGQVGEGAVLLQSMMREERGGVLRAYRCLALFSLADSKGAGGVATIDLAPERLESLERLDRDLDVRDTLLRVFSLALCGISTVSKA